jgi:hypothetical protein
MELSVYSVDKEQKVAVDESQELAIEIVDAFVPSLFIC